MELAQPQRPDGSSHAVGFGVVLAVHLVIGYAIVSGLAKKVVDIVREPIEARLIDEVRAPPPPPPPEQPKPVVKLAPPPPAAPYVPPPEVVVAAPATPAPSITATSPVPPPTAQDFRPAPPPAPPARTEPLSIGVACPTQVAPVLPLRARQEGITGQVRAQVTIRSGKVVDVQILSSKPRGLFDAAVRTALLQYGCQTTGTDEIIAAQTFDFRAD